MLSFFFSFDLSATEEMEGDRGLISVEESDDGEAAAGSIGVKWGRLSHLSGWNWKINQILK
jgi:hypothetical protein